MRIEIRKFGGSARVSFEAETEAEKCQIQSLILNATTIGMEIKAYSAGVVLNANLKFSSPSE